jgi:uncharacterized protein (TIGR02217 family)
MMFIETPRFPDQVSYGASGGPSYKTDVTEVSSGYEARNANWSAGRAMYEVSHGVNSSDDLNILISMFRTAKGKANSFRFKDWMDYTVTAPQSAFRALSATQFMMQKKYTFGAEEELRDINKPVNGTVVIIGGVGPSVDYATGIVTVLSGTPTGWSGEFDVPCRFDIDHMKASVDAFAIYSWGSIPVIEIKLDIVVPPP